MNPWFSRFCGVLLIVAQVPVSAQGEAPYAPQVVSHKPDRVLWGDTHLHTSLSVDAYAFGNRSIGPEEAYRFAKGGTVTAFNGQPVRLKRPLDFIVIADHAENLGLLPELEKGNTGALEPGKAQGWRERFAAAWQGVKDDPERSVQLWQDVSGASFMEGNALTAQARRSIWQRVARLADAENEPGRFTAFIGYEWTQWNEWLHRVVVYRDDERRAVQMLPFTALESGDPEDLWQWMDAYERRTGGRLLAIPHNSNLTSGTMFALHRGSGEAFTVDYARARQRWEPLLEITQAKGDSETHPLLSPDDEFANFERMSMPARAGSKPDHMRPYEYARSALKLGLSEQSRLGVNPFKYGMAGGTDMHTGLSTTDEENFWGASTSLSGPHRDRILGPWLPHARVPGALPTDPGQAGWTMSAAGLTAVWAEENTRDAIFAAMLRRETYATTGPRILLRFFGGWEFEPWDAVRPDVAEAGYRKGVPMGGDLEAAPSGRAPAFLIRAARDPLGANLDRIQIVKGWQSRDGRLHELVHDVAFSGTRVRDTRGRVPPVGNTVDVAEASYWNSVGSPELSAVWRDPGFDPEEPAAYYVRVIEIPTPKWTAFDARYFDIRDLPPEVPLTTQERAYSSPIWYTPHAGIGGEEDVRLPRDKTR